MRDPSWFARFRRRFEVDHLAAFFNGAAGALVCRICHRQIDGGVQCLKDGDVVVFLPHLKLVFGSESIREEEVDFEDLRGSCVCNSCKPTLERRGTDLFDLRDTWRNLLLPARERAERMAIHRAEKEAVVSAAVRVAVASAAERLQPVSAGTGTAVHVALSLADGTERERRAQRLMTKRLFAKQMREDEKVRQARLHRGGRRPVLA